jgi:hypothetical protein
VTGFPEVLDSIRRNYGSLFDEAALTEPPEEELTVPVSDISIPRPEDLRSPVGEERPPDLPVWDDDNPWLDVDQQGSGFERNSPRAREELQGFEGRPTRVGVELLAVYLPFHFYPKGHWGIHFFERPMARFTDHLYWRCRRRGLACPWGYALKIAAYYVARHEFFHYTTELAALDLELKQGRRVYRPYWDHVYKATYAGPDCLEETIANVWSWDNTVIRSPASLRDVLHDLIRCTPSFAYARGADLNSKTVRPEEDALVAQLQQCARKPSAPPPVWGILPRPYVQPWTRYENLTFTMDCSLGGRLGSMLRARPLRKTIRIYHR